MAKICRKCNRNKEEPRDEKTGKRPPHVCPIVTIQCKKKDEATQSFPTKIVHEDRVAKDGDLHSLVTGKKAPWQVVFRNRQKIENVIEKRKTKKAKKGEKQLVAPSGEPLTPPTKG